MSATESSSENKPRSGRGGAQVSRSQFLQLFSAVMLPMFMAASDQTLLATSTAVIAAQFGQLYDTSWLATAYLLTTAVMIPIYGRLGDRHGRREMLFVAMGIFLVGSLACATAQNMAWLIVGRALQGMGGGGLMTLSQAMIAELVPPQQRIRFQGYFAIIFTMANVLGPIIGGFTVAHVSWRWLFAAQIPLTLLASWRLGKLPRGKAHPDAPGVADVGGLVLFTVATMALLFGLSSAGHRFAWLSGWTVLLFGGGAALWFWLVAHERRVAAPFFPMELMRIRVVSLSVNTIVCNSICRLALVFYLPLYLQFGAQMDAGKAGLLLVPIMIGTLIAQQSSSRIGFRTGTLHLMPAVGAALTCIGMLGLALVPPTEWLLVSFGCIVGLGLGPAMPCTQYLVQAAAGRSRLGAVTSVIMLARTSGAALGAAVTGAIIYGLLPDVDIGHLMDGEETRSIEEVLRAFHIQFFFLAAVSGYSTLVASRMPRVRI